MQQLEPSLLKKIMRILSNLMYLLGRVFGNLTDGTVIRELFDSLMEGFYDRIQETAAEEATRD